MISGDDDPPKMIGAKKHRVMTHTMDLSSLKIKKELLRQVTLSNSDTYIDEAVSDSTLTLKPSSQVRYDYNTSLLRVSRDARAIKWQCILILLIR